MNYLWPATSAVALANLSHHQRNHQSDNVPCTLPPQLHLAQPEKNDDEWNRLGKLVLLSALSALGTLGNIFAISAVMTEKQLKKKGNVLLVNLMLAGLVITAGVLPADIIALLAGWSSPTPVCPAAWVLSCLAAHTALATLPCLAWENRRRLRGRPLSTAALIALLFVCWATSVSLTCSQWVWGLGPSHCGGAASPANDTVYKIFTSSAGILLVLTPLVLSIAVQARTLLAAHTHPPRRGGAAFSSGETNPIIYASGRELALPATNLAVTAVAGSCWAVGVASDWWADDALVHSLAWFPFSAATATGFLYAGHRPFRDAYVQLFHYCCCKTSVSLAHRGRNDAAVATANSVATAARPATKDVRVHMIPAYNIGRYSKATAREHRQAPHRPPRPKDRGRSAPVHKKDVYEL